MMFSVSWVKVIVWFFSASRYIPEAWLKKLENLSEQGKNEINSINHQMVNQLKSTDSAFSLGEWCGHVLNN